MMKDAGFDIDELNFDGFGDPELDALAKEMGKYSDYNFIISDGADDEFAELNDL
jgi:hypothetical protein